MKKKTFFILVIMIGTVFIAWLIKWQYSLSLNDGRRVYGLPPKCEFGTYLIFNAPPMPPGPSSGYCEAWLTPLFESLNI